jgi:hypothetical protein
VRRECVTAAGSWNPGLFSSEEIDLLTRMKRAGSRMRFVDVPMIRHHTAGVSPLRAVLRNFLPSAGLGKKYYGFGQLLHARAREGRLGALVAGYPLPFVYLGSLLAGGALAAAGLPLWGAAIAVSGGAYVAWSRGVRFLAVYLGYVPQAVAGWSRYRGDCQPRIRSVSRRGERERRAVEGAAGRG